MTLAVLILTKIKAYDKIKHRCSFQTHNHWRKKMVALKHSKSPIGTFNPEWGHIYAVFSAFDNSSIAFMTYIGDYNTEHMRVIFKDRVLADGHGANVESAFSFDGKKMAVAIKEGNPLRYVIYINGAKFYELDPIYDNLYHFMWISNDELAWEAWILEDNNGPIKENHKYINGKKVSDFGITPFGYGRTSQIFVKSGNEEFIVFDDGSRSEVQPLRKHWPFGLPTTTTDDSPQPEKEYNEQIDRVRVVFNGHKGPWFDDIESGGGLRTFAFTDDQSKLAYLGIRYAKITNLIAPLFGKALERAFEIEDKTGKVPWWAKPLTLLYNPYFGPLHALAEMSKRWYVVDNGHMWKKAYHQALDHFYTPNGQLVVTVLDDNKNRVVIDEDEGPAFDCIQDVRYLPDEGCISYIGRLGNEYFKVTAK